MTATRTHFYLLFALVASICWGCSADETIDAPKGGLRNDSTIHFAVTTETVEEEASTRAELFNSTEAFATEGRKFSVCAYDYREDIGEQLMIGSQTGTTVTGVDVTCHVSDDNGVTSTNWTTGDHYYWPQISHTVRFYAVYPQTTFSKTSSDVTFDFDASEERLDNDDIGDPLMAYLAMGRTEARDYDYAAPLHFRHALSKISFTATTSEPGWTLTVNSITVHNLYDKGHIGIRNGTMAPSSLATSARTFTMTNNQAEAQVVLPQKRAAWQPGFYFISQNDAFATTDTLATGTYLAIECAIWNGSAYKLGTGTGADNITTYQTIYCPVAPDWQPNTHYRYILNFRAPGYGNAAYNEEGGPIYDVASVALTATVIADWSNGESSEVHVK